MPAFDIRAKVVSNVRVTDNVCVLTFAMIEPQELQFKAGQYLFVHASERVLRPFSISSSPDDIKTFEFCIEVIPDGVASNYLWNLKEHDEVLLKGVFGSFVYHKDPDIEEIFMIATGTGIAPIKSMLLYELNHGEKRPIHLLFGESMAKDFYYLDIFAELIKKYPNLTCDLCASRDQKEGYINGRVQTALEKYFPIGKKSSFYICGGRQMIMDVSDLIIKNGGDAKHIYHEKFF